MITVPNSAIPLILLQRTHYLWLPKWKRLNRVLSSLSGRPPINAAVLIESHLRRRRIVEAFNADIRREYEDLRAHLPKCPAAILDLGCGVAGLAVHLFRHYQGASTPRIYLLDRTQTVDTISYGLSSTTGEFYNSLEVARGLLVTNGVPDEKIVTLEATDDCRIEITEPLDLVLSTISWGFHYPVATYLDRVYELLRPGGRMIIDVRKGSGGVGEVRARFGGSTGVISEGVKRERVMAIKP